MKAKKSLGQNFLKSEKALNQMIGIADICARDIVLEIGPGKGALTEKILKLAGKVVAIEKDEELVLFLKDKFSKEINEGRFDLIEEDILDFDEEKLRFYKQKYKLVANIPYYITGAIIRKFLESNFQPESITLLVQKEVADRVVARDGKESILSMSVKVYGEPEYVDKVSKRYFTPEPKVDSAIIHISNISKTNFKNIKEKGFFEFIKLCFGQKRKTLLNNLDSLNKKGQILEFLNSKKLSEKLRAEDIKLDTFLELYKFLFPQD